MRKTLILFIALVSSGFLWTQTKTSFFWAYDNIALFQNKELNKIHNDFGYNIHSRDNRFSISKNICKKKIIWNCGISAMKIDVVIKDRITHWNYVVANYYGSGGYVYDTIYQQYKDPKDLIFKSLSFGVINEILIPIKEKNFENKFSHQIGLKNEIYFIEFYKSYFESSDPIPESGNVYTGTSTSPYSIIKSSEKIIKYTNFSFFYRPSFNLKENISIACKISLGTNLYSDWDKFKKYAWLGVGLELGFGKKPLFKKKEK